MREKIFVGALIYLGLVASSAYAAPNPASLYCTQNGGSLEIIRSRAGEWGLCKFSRGCPHGESACFRHSECEEWAYYRGECAQWSCSTWVVEYDSNGQMQSYCGQN